MERSGEEIQRLGTMGREREGKLKVMAGEGSGKGISSGALKRGEKKDRVTQV